MSPARRPSSSSRAQPVGDQARLGAAPRLVAALREAEPRRRLVPALRARDEQLDGRRARGRVEREQPQRPVLVHRDLLAAGAQRREARAELGRERGVEDVQQLLAGAEVDREPAHLARAELRRRGRGRSSRRRAGSGRSTGTRRRPRTGCRARAPRRIPSWTAFVSWNSSIMISSKRSAQRSPRRRVLEQVAGAQLEVVEVDRRALGLGVRRRRRRSGPAGRRGASSAARAWKSAHAARYAPHAVR